ncbi:MAG: HNH endonuclease [Candidatus Sumerlaeia bacterium]|nr:HNH endonuclease [Candidatus Sumerlaeia bacterium]
MEIIKSPTYQEQAWNADKANLTPANMKLAQAIFDFAALELGSEVHHRPNKNKQGRDRETIFRVKSVEGFWLVVNTSKGRLKLIFPDKDDLISSINEIIVEYAQWERKREKRALISAEAGIDQFPDVRYLIDQVHSNALDYYSRTSDFTQTLLIHFGEPSGGQKLQVPSKETFQKLLINDGRCCVCNGKERLSVYQLKEDWNLFCDLHHPQASQWISFGKKGVPFSVRKHVWNRDGGKCTSCGSTYFISFDHMIPASRGGKHPFTGSNLETNIMLKCRKCNLSKSDSLIP